MKKRTLALSLLFLAIILVTLFLAHLQLFTYPTAKIKALANLNIVYLSAIISSLVVTIISALTPLIVFNIVQSIGKSGADPAKNQHRLDVMIAFLINNLFVVGATVIVTMITKNHIDPSLTLAIYYGGVLIQLYLSYLAFKQRTKQYLWFGVIVLLLASIMPSMQLIQGL
ncbi:hypothetical protein ACNAN0_12330 [Agrilactobacillus fermenti]|uniref:hypothetical protein n=1 Tax=Agrilactobacillus fermenti TaxID=2586909 RepID=UPI003A5C5BDA